MRPRWVVTVRSRTPSRSPIRRAVSPSAGYPQDLALAVGELGLDLPAALQALGDLRTHSDGGPIEHHLAVRPSRRACRNSSGSAFLSCLRPPHEQRPEIDIASPAHRTRGPRRPGGALGSPSQPVRVPARPPARGRSRRPRGPGGAARDPCERLVGRARLEHDVHVGTLVDESAGRGAAQRQRVDEDDAQPSPWRRESLRTIELECARHVPLSAGGGSD